MDKESGTKIIDALESELTDWATNKLAGMIRDGRGRKIGTYEGTPIYRIGDEGEGYVVLYHQDEVIYFVRHRRIRHNGNLFGRQVLVWRNDDIEGSGGPAAGFALYCFFKLLLPRYKALIADQEQTKRGRAFWQYALREAFQRNLYVYYLDRRSTPNRLIELREWREAYETYAKELWGYSEGHKRTFAVVSLKPIALKQKL